MGFLSLQFFFSSEPPLILVTLEKGANQIKLCWQTAIYNIRTSSMGYNERMKAVESKCSLISGLLPAFLLIIVGFASRGMCWNRQEGDDPQAEWVHRRMIFVLLLLPPLYRGEMTWAFTPRSVQGEKADKKDNCNSSTHISINLNVSTTYER